MHEPEFLINYVILGQLVNRLYYPIIREYKGVIEAAENLARLTKQLGFAVTATRLALWLTVVEQAHKKHPERFESQALGEIVPQQYAHKMLEIVSKLDEILQKEMGDAEFVRINRGVVSNGLRDLLVMAVDEHQRTLVHEASRCLECGANRSAIVMGWNLAFDHFRQWVFCSPRKRLKDLNAVLKAKGMTAIVIYEDFFDIPEKTLIDRAKEANLFKRNMQNFLNSALSTRNSFAHPSHMVASPEQAAGYIDGLIKNVIANPHFAFKAKTTR